MTWTSEKETWISEKLTWTVTDKLGSFELVQCNHVTLYIQTSIVCVCWLDLGVPHLSKIKNVHM